MVLRTFFPFPFIASFDAQRETKKSQERLWMLPKYARREAAPNNQAENSRFRNIFDRCASKNNFHDFQWRRTNIFQLCLGEQDGIGAARLMTQKSSFDGCCWQTIDPRPEKRTPSGNSATQYVAGASGIVPNALLFDFFPCQPSSNDSNYFNSNDILWHFFCFRTQLLFLESILAAPVVIPPERSKEEPRMFSETSRGN